MRRIILVFSVIFLGIITITTGCGREKNVSIDELNKALVSSPQDFASWFIICAPKVTLYIKNID